MLLSSGIIQIFIGFLRKKIKIKRKVMRRYIRELSKHGEIRKRKNLVKIHKVENLRIHKIDKLSHKLSWMKNFLIKLLISKMNLNKVNKIKLIKI
jgi:hypothetical protein